MDEIKYYIYVFESQYLSKRELHEKIKNKEYARLSSKTKDKLINKTSLNAKDLVPNPILIKTENIHKEVSEYALKELILNNLDNFLFINML